MEFIGRIARMLPLQSGTSQNGNSWKRQDFVFEYFEHETDRWSDKVVLSLMNDRIAEHDLHEGDEVKIGFSHNVREYNMKVFNELRAYKIEKLANSITLNRAQQKKLAQEAESTASTPQATIQKTQLVDVPAQPTDQQENDDLPF